MRLIVVILTLCIAFCTACNNTSNYSEHSTGLEYKFIETNTQGESPKNGDIVVLSIKFLTVDNKLIDASDFYRMQVSNSTYLGDLHSGLQMLQVGDSVCFKFDASDFYEKTRKTDLPKELKPGDEVLVYLRLKNIITAENLESERRSLFHTDESQEINLLDAYLERTSISVEPTESGMYIIHKKDGSGEFPKKGAKLFVHYTGTTIDGKVFDTSLDKGKPLTFILGSGKMIKGFDEAFKQIRKGGKARLIIPSSLAYGKEGLNEGFKKILLPYSTLVFDVELIEIQ